MSVKKRPYPDISAIKVFIFPIPCMRRTVLGQIHPV